MNERRNDIGMKSIVSICIVIIASLFAWFITSVGGTSVKALDNSTTNKTTIAVHEQKFTTLEKQMDTVITKQDTMDDKIDILIAR